MSNRTRPIRIEFCVSEYEHRLIKNKMAQLGTHNMGAYLRKMAIDGYIIKVDYVFNTLFYHYYYIITHIPCLYHFQNFLSPAR